jgi:gliding motility-associated-like protein
MPNSHLRFILICIASFYFSSRQAQLLFQNVHSKTTNNQQILDRSTTQEADCDNGVDDDGDGLVDMNDRHCYFSADSAQGCSPSPIIWITSPNGIYWINLLTKEERQVSTLINEFMDISWSATGTLYAVDRYGVVSTIDPLTWMPTELTTITEFSPNGMTLDGDGQIYLTGYSSAAYTQVVRYNERTHETELIVQLSDYDLTPGGDCCFLNGFLYVACEGYIAKVDVVNKTLEKFQITDVQTSFAITSTGDGYLYITDNTTAVYQLDPVTMKTTFYQAFSDPEMLVFGFASYTDACDGPCKGNKPTVILRDDTLLCMSTSIMLSNLTSGGPRDKFLWSNNSIQSSISVTTPGTYWLQVSNVCGSGADTVHILPKVDSCQCFVHVPNAFSPNDDGVNDQFRLSSTCLTQGTIEIFNRWGHVVYKSKTLDEGWRGTHNGRQQAGGIYVYVIRFNYLGRPGAFVRSGTITLVR